MPIQSALPRRDLEALANTRRITFASKLCKPEALEGSDAKANDITPPTTTALTLPFAKFHTHVKVFMVSTGDDPGDECELQGYIRFTYPPPAASREIDREMPVKKSWASENGGLGRFLDEFTNDSTAVPTNFHVFLAEDDVFGDDIIINSGIDWTPQNLHMADGRAWRYQSWNLGDTRFRATVWFQVTRLP